MTVTSAYRTQANASTESILAVDISNIIWHVGEPTECPLKTLIGGSLYLTGENKPEQVKGKIKTEIAKEVDYKVAEKDPLARTVTVATAVSDTTTTTVILSSNTNLRVGDNIKNISQENGEFMHVYAVDSGGANISARRNIGSTSFQIIAGDVFKVVGYGQKEGGGKASLKSQLASTRTRRVQIFKRSFGITDTLKNIVLETALVDAWDEEANQAMSEFKKDIEFSYWWNPASDSTTDTGSNTVNLTRGIIAELNTGDYVLDAGNPTEADFFGSICEDIFAYGPRRKTMFCNARTRSKIAEWSRSKLQTKITETKFGLTVKELESDHGILELVTGGPLSYFLPDTSNGMAVVLDLDRVVEKFIKNRNAKYEENIQTAGDDAKEAQYISECGILLRSLLHHKLLWNI